MALTDEEWKIAIEEKISQLKNTDNDGTVGAHTGGTQTKFITITHPLDPLFPLTIDHTLLKPDATSAQIYVLCYEAIRNWVSSRGKYGSCKSVVSSTLDNNTQHSITILPPYYKAKPKTPSSTARAKLTWVINIGALKYQSYTTVFNDICAVAEACHVYQPQLHPHDLRSSKSSLTQPSEEAMRKVNLKVILETIFLSDSEKIAGAFITAEAGADFVKMCIGFGGGGATMEDVGFCIGLWNILLGGMMGRVIKSK
ncbi:hypothetical protein GG344DRAFT_76698 [Lentinula edodes]|nr:hypothetical protein GG344DRAFT_76698 [Lentinula edodes]